jgi:hypothetical protein
MGLGERIDKSYLSGILVWGGNRFEMFLQAGHEMAGWMDAGLQHNKTLTINPLIGLTANGTLSFEL